MRPHVEGLAARGVVAEALQLPRSSVTRAADVFRHAAGTALPTTAIGGHSFGGRAASLVAAADTVLALVLLSYPLHRPGHPEELRIDHWPQIRCPVLLLSGESDPFARVELLRDAVHRIPDAELVTYAGVGHGLAPVLDDALDRVAAFLSGCT